MQITLRYLDGCPNWQLAEARLREALAAAGAPEVAIARERVTTQADAERRGFRGSPTLLVDGADPFADERGAGGLACRICPTEQGPQGAPSVAQLRAMLRRA